jgi:hypothetical protein
MWVPRTEMMGVILDLSAYYTVGTTPKFHVSNQQWLIAIMGRLESKTILHSWKGKKNEM